MARYVDVEGKTFPTPHRKILNDFINGWNTCLNSVLQQPTADVIEVRHGEWIDDGDCFHCSDCGKTYQLGSLQTIYDVKRCWAYCASCGAKMDKGEEENAEIICSK